MKKRGAVYLFWGVFCALILLQSGTAVCAEPVDKIPAAKFTLPAPDSAQAQKYLGLKAMAPFGISDIKAPLVVVEFMSAMCPHCLANAPIMNKIYKTIQSDSRLADIKVISIAVGSEKAEVDAYGKKFNVPFPVFVDEDSSISASMEGVPTPTTMIIATENGKVLFSHTGVIQDPDQFVKELKTLHKKK
jgi:peroxiredoxin